MIKTKIDDILADIAFLDEPPDSNALLKNDLGLDSLSTVELIVSIEDTFCIQFDESDLDPQRIQTVDDIYQLIARYVKEYDYDI